jgi:hypothetical protein
MEQNEISHCILNSINLFVWNYTAYNYNCYKQTHTDLLDANFCETTQTQHHTNRIWCISSVHYWLVSHFTGVLGNPVAAGPNPASHLHSPIYKFAPILIEVGKQFILSSSQSFRSVK